MIQSVLIFRDSGILIYKKEINLNELKKSENNCIENNEYSENLITGFFSVIFQYFSNKFGIIQSIKTKNNLILIKKIDDVFLTLIMRIIEQNIENFDEEIDKVLFGNKRLEEIAENTLKSLENKLISYLKKLKINKEENCLNSPIHIEIDKNFSEIIESNQKKMQELIQKLKNNLYDNIKL